MLEMILECVKLLKLYFFGEQHTYPTQADSIILTSGEADWQWGDYAEVVPAGTVAKPFTISAVGIGVVTATDAVYEVELFAGAIGHESEIGQMRVYRQANQSGTSPTPMRTKLQPMGTRISARCAVEGGGSETIGIAIFYLIY